MAHFRSAFATVSLFSLLLLHCGGEPTPEPQTPEGPPLMEPAPELPPAEPAATAPVTESPPPEPEAPKPEPLTDEQIAAISDAANTAEVEQAKLAQQKGKNGRVKKFAGMMVTDHGQAKSKQAKLVKKLKLTLAENPMSTQIASDSKTTLDDLKTATGADFDRAYIDVQIKMHEKVLSALDTQLIPQAKDAELKALLEEIRSKVEAHLKEAQDIQQALASAPAEEKPAGKGGAAPPSGSKSGGTAKPPMPAAGEPANK